MSPAEIRNLLVLDVDACHFVFQGFLLLTTLPDTGRGTLVTI
jgi:hypothetical protein